jgi:8-oxo-dGTP pyrophosphatase MutT (NUDIX family)
MWIPPDAAPAVPWSAVEGTLRWAYRSETPFKISARIPESPRRAAVAVLMRGDAEGARELLLVQRGHDAPQHAGEIALPGGMVEPFDRDLPATARRELAEELGITEGLWEIGCFPDGVAKARTRFTPVLFRWETEAPRWTVDAELASAFLLPLRPLAQAPWTVESLTRQNLTLQVPRLELPQGPLWGATAYVLKAWLDHLAEALRDGGGAPGDRPGPSAPR